MRPALLIVALACAIPFPAHAQNPPEANSGLDSSFVRDICIDELFVPNTIVVESPKVPIGCKLIDCCPKCGFTPEIRIAIGLESELNADLVVEFENLADPSRLRLTPPTAATWTGNKLNVMDDVVVSGLQRDPTTDAVMARARLMIDNPLTTATITLAEIEELGATTVDVALSADDFPLSTYSFRFRPRLCSPAAVYPQPAGDLLRLENNTGADKSVVLLDAESVNGCIDDSRAEIETSASYTNIQAPSAACRNEISVYSKDDAAVLLDDVDVSAWGEWEDTAGDIQKVDLAQEPWEMPSNVWIAAPSSDEEALLLNIVLAGTLDIPLVFDPHNSPAMLEVRARDNFDEANFLLNQNRAGIDVKEKASYEIVTERTGLAAIYTTAMLMHTTLECSMASILEYQDLYGLDTPIYKEGELNVYYVAADWLTGYADPITGMECEGVVFVGTGGSPTTLLHELGHVFSLAHVNSGGSDCDGVPGDDFGNNNIMWAMATARDEFTIGQVFRMNFNDTSGLNMFPKSAPARTTGRTVSCPDDASDETCVCLGQR